MAKITDQKKWSVNWNGPVRLLVAIALAAPVLATSPATPGSATPHAQPALLQMASESPNSRVNVIVQKSGKDNNAEALVAHLGGAVTQDLRIINAFAADVSAQAIPELATAASVRWVSLDAPVVPNICSQCIDTTRLQDAYIRTIGADRIWNDNPYRQGQGITVAVVDSGISPHNDLKEQYGGGGNLRVRASVVFNNSTSTWEDHYGHGTHISGIIAGNGSQSQRARMGVAPKVDLINVKIEDDQGYTRASDMVAGMQWILDNKDVHNIRVVNLSLNSSVFESYLTSPLTAAVEILWFNRIVVVVSAGNDGIVNPPANDPFVITVGATKDMGTASMSDDVVAPYSSYGVTLDGVAKPDLVAPGHSITSLLASTSGTLYQQHPGNLATGFTGAGNYFRMSGTSMAAPMVTGAVALLLQDEPNLTPDQVKYRLKTTAVRNNGTWPAYNQASAGSGYLDVYAAVRGNTTQSSNSGIRANELLWTGGQPVNWNSVNWNSVNWNSVNWNSVNWNSVNWNSDYWGQ